MIDLSTRELVFELAHGYCLCCHSCDRKAGEIHHKLPNTKANKKLFPLFIDSIFNLCPINHDCHMSKPLPTISVHMAGIYEEWMKGI